MSLMHGTSLLTTPGHFGPHVSKKEDEESCVLKKLGFMYLYALGTTFLNHVKMSTMRSTHAY